MDRLVLCDENAFTFRDGDAFQAEEVYFINSRDVQNHHGGIVLDDYCVQIDPHHRGIRNRCLGGRSDFSLRQIRLNLTSLSRGVVFHR